MRRYILVEKHVLTITISLGACGVVIGIYYVTHLDTVPVSNRTRFMDCSPEEETKLARQAYNMTMQQYGNRILPAYHPYTQFVRRVASRLITAGGMEDLKWEFYVIDSPEMNAFVLPGGKVFVFTVGIKICAVVMLVCVF